MSVVTNQLIDSCKIMYLEKKWSLYRRVTNIKIGRSLVHFDVEVGEGVGE